MSLPPPERDQRHEDRSSSVPTDVRVLYSSFTCKCFLQPILVNHTCERRCMREVSSRSVDVWHYLTTPPPPPRSSSSAGRCQVTWYHRGSRPPQRVHSNLLYGGSTPSEGVNSLELAAPEGLTHWESWRPGQSSHHFP